MTYGAVFAHLFGLHPWDVDRLDLEQFRQFRKFADEWVKAQKQTGE